MKAFNEWKYNNLDFYDSLSFEEQINLKSLFDEYEDKLEESNSVFAYGVINGIDYMGAMGLGMREEAEKALKKIDNYINQLK